ncbi:hypothetical protein [Halorussus amylolyticus]|uniref:hypothetical protein n=1 Tax=Halorussus amylolyticus TaxID=1126242 RepID=UPI001047A065|nr:hypothetical protein [Halorussus amylolyticus]
MSDQTPEAWSSEEKASHMAEQLCVGFRAHDSRDREEAIEAFWAVDSLQFAHLDRDTARRASLAYVDALWNKDDLEVSHMPDGEIDYDSLSDADWEPVRSKFRERASIVGIDPRYADASTRAWKNHKVGGDYWSPIQRAQVYELRAAMQDPEYPYKPRYGKSGHGPEASRYALAVELHDMRTQKHWEQAKRTMIPYFERILDSHHHV